MSLQVQKEKLGTPFLSVLSSCRNALRNWLFLSDKIFGCVTRRVLWISMGGVDGWEVPWNKNPRTVLYTPHHGKSDSILNL